MCLNALLEEARGSCREMLQGGMGEQLMTFLVSGAWQLLGIVAEHCGCAGHSKLLLTTLLQVTSSITH